MRMLTLLAILAGGFWCSVWGQDTPPLNFPWEAFNPHGSVLCGVDSSYFRQIYHLNSGTQIVRRSRKERKDTASEWKEDGNEFTTSYFLTSWCGREGGDVIYLCGLKASGESVVEKWTFTVPAGRWVVRYPAPAPPIGTPAATWNPIITVKGGGEWRWSKVLPYPPNPQKTILYEGPLGPFSSATVDPEGRQLIVYDFAEKAIKRMRLLDSPPAFETLFSVSSHPHLSQVAEMDIRDFSGQGRKLLMWKQYAQTFVGANEVHTIASDTDNDGNFDGVLSLDVAAFDASPYRDWSLWKEFWRLPD